MKNERVFKKMSLAASRDCLRMLPNTLSAAGLGPDCIKEGLQVLRFAPSDPFSLCFPFFFCSRRFFLPLVITRITSSLKFVNFNKYNMPSGVCWLCSRVVHFFKKKTTQTKLQQFISLAEKCFLTSTLMRKSRR